MVGASFRVQHPPSCQYPPSPRSARGSAKLLVHAISCQVLSVERMIIIMVRQKTKDLHDRRNETKRGIERTCRIQDRIEAHMMDSARRERLYLEQTGIPWQLWMRAGRKPQGERTRRIWARVYRHAREGANREWLALIRANILSGTK